MFWIMQRTGKPDPGMMANGMLAGLVAITAPCAFVEPVGGGGHRLHRRRPRRRGRVASSRSCKVDDPVGAIAVHGVAAPSACCASGIFANGTYGAGWNLTTKGAAASAKGVTGILYDFELGGRQLLAQAHRRS